MKRVTHADRSNGIPAVTLNKSRKYHTPDGMLESALPSEFEFGSRLPITPINSVVMKYRAKNVTNFTKTERNTNPRSAFSADRTIPNIRHL
jgi:hypothetical protein